MNEFSCFKFILLLCKPEAEILFQKQILVIILYEKLKF